jgi:hypothetical protein
MGKIRSANHNQLHRLSLEPASAGYLLFLLFDPEVEAICSSETSGSFPATRRHNPEERTRLSTQLFGAWSRERSVGVATYWSADGYDVMSFISGRGKRHLFLYLTPRPLPRPTPTSVQ